MICQQLISGRSLQ